MDKNTVFIDNKFGCLKAYYQKPKLDFFDETLANNIDFDCIKVPVECRPDGIPHADVEGFDAEEIISECLDYMDDKVKNAPKTCRALTKCFSPEDTSMSPEDREAFH